MLADDVRRGLEARPRWLPPKYFYDHAGSVLFERITELPEYYLTRVEEVIIRDVAPEVMRRARPRDIVELGPGSCRKVRFLFDAIGGRNDVRYVPFDVGRDGLAKAGGALLHDYPAVDVHAVIGDFRPEAYRHHAFYRTEASRIEMHLIATAPQRVRLRRLGLVVELAEAEGIWTESSYKFTRESTETMLAEAGLAIDAWYTDAEGRFGLVLARPLPPDAAR